MRQFTQDIHGKSIGDHRHKSPQFKVNEDPPYELCKY